MQLTTATGNLGLDPYAEMRRLEHLPKSEQTAKVAAQFEAILVKQFLTEAMKPLTEAKSENGSVPGGDIYDSMVVDSMAKGIEDGGGLGLSNVISLQLQGYARKGANRTAQNADDNA
jgi:Rod binding domain-containing protein